MRTLFLYLLLLLPLHAQMEVGLDIKRRTWIRGEALIAKVTITNNAGHELELADEPHKPWFSFEIVRGADSPVPAANPDYHLDPVIIAPGETLKRSLDLTRLYSMHEFGTYKITAAVYMNERKQYFTSEPYKVEITDGKTVWSQTAGVPDGMPGAGSVHKYSLLSFQQSNALTAYVRVEDADTQQILATYPMGRILGGAVPNGMLGPDNTLYALHATAPSTFLLTKISIQGDWLEQSVWESRKGRAELRRKPDGTMVVAGASRQQKADENAPPPPKLSDRPVVLPK